MISTDVVQAGLDIPQCTMVLRYDVSQNSVKELIMGICF